MLASFFIIFLLSSRLAGGVSKPEEARATIHPPANCVVKAGGSPDIDDAPAIIDAFDKSQWKGYIL
jgi:hypothetical protein